MRLFLFLALSAVCLATSAQNWPQWRGPLRDGHAAPGQKLSLSSIQGAAPLWRIPVGGGFSSPILYNDSAFLLDLQEGKEVLRCLRLSTGEELWRTPFAEGYADEWGAGPRSTPFTDGKTVFAQSCNGEFRAFSAETGKILWGFSFSDFGVRFLGSKAREGTASRRGNNGSGILDHDAVIVPVGSTNNATLVCFEKLTGKLLWKTGTDEAAYSSLMVAYLAGAKQVIAFTADALLGVNRITGEMLWRVPLRTNAKRHAATPVISGNSIIVNSHTFGLLCYEVRQENGKFEAVQKWKNEELKINLATPVIVGSHLYSHGPNRNFVCASLETGATVWKAEGYGKDYSSTLAFGNDLLTLTDEGELVVIEATPEKYREKGRLQVCGRNWNYPAAGQGKLLIRDQRELTCYALE